MTQPSAPGPIVLGRIDESFHQVAAAVVEEVLLRLGHEVDGRRRLVRHPVVAAQYLNDIHDMRPLDDQLGVFPPPDRASLVAHRAAFSRLPERTCDVLARIRFTIADVNAMDVAVNLDGLDPLAAAGSGWAAVPEPYETGWAERTR